MTRKSGDWRRDNGVGKLRITKGKRYLGQRLLSVLHKKKKKWRRINGGDWRKKRKRNRNEQEQKTHWPKIFSDCVLYSHEYKVRKYALNFLFFLLLTIGSSEVKNRLRLFVVVFLAAYAQLGRRETYAYTSNQCGDSWWKRCHCCLSVCSDGERGKGSVFACVKVWFVVTLRRIRCYARRHSIGLLPSSRVQKQKYAYFSWVLTVGRERVRAKSKSTERILS